jgi:nucleotide-binding universal stress UspA family protein
VSTILIGVDDSTRSEDAVAFARRLAGASSGRVIVASAFPYTEVPTRGANFAYRDIVKQDATRDVRRMSGLLELIAPERIETRVVANTSPAHALHDLAVSEHASIVVVGSTRTGTLGRVLPGATAERLLHGAPCPVAIVPDGYRSLKHPAIRRIGVAYDGSDESRAALAGAIEVARALHDELELIGVVDAEVYGTPGLMGGPSYSELRDTLDAAAQQQLEAALPQDVTATPVRLAGRPAEQLIERSEQLDLLILGSRGYGPLHAVLAGGVSGRVVRAAHCPVIVVPRGVEAPLGELFGAAATTAT